MRQRGRIAREQRAVRPSLARPRPQVVDRMAGRRAIEAARAVLGLDDRQDIGIDEVRGSVVGIGGEEASDRLGLRVVGERRVDVVVDGGDPHCPGHTRMLTCGLHQAPRKPLRGRAAPAVSCVDHARRGGGEPMSSRSTGCPVISATSSKSLSRWRTVRPASSAVAAMRRSGTDGARCWLRSASTDWSSSARSSILGVRYSTGIDAIGGSVRSEGWSPADRAE